MYSRSMFTVCSSDQFDIMEMVDMTRDESVDVLVWSVWCVRVVVTGPDLLQDINTDLSLPPAPARPAAQSDTHSFSETCLATTRHHTVLT